MTIDDNQRDQQRQLQTLERWRSAELESAQTEHARLARTAVEKESARDSVQADLDETQSFARRQLTSSQPINVESLRQIGEFTALQRQELAAAESALAESRTHCEAAHEQVVKQFEELSVVQRLGKRRELEAGRDAERTRQKRLDEQALSRLAAAIESRAKQPEE
jgi:type IV secretory pathway VirB9-like protein